MSKITTIRLKNFKAIDSLEMNFNGCTAIVTAGNNKGKTSFLRGIQDRIRFSRPDIMVKEGEKEGHGEMILDTGEKFIWDFDTQGKDKLIYVTNDGVKTPVTMAIGKRFFPELFDIDKFLQSPPKEQTKQLQKILGVDFTEIEERYTKAYNERHARNEEAERFHVKLSKMLEVPFVASVDLTDLQTKKTTERDRLNELYLMNVAHNKKLRDEYTAKKTEIDERVKSHNESRSERLANHRKCSEALKVLKENLYGGSEVETWLLEFLKKTPEPIVAVDMYPAEPAYIKELPSDEALQKIDAEILTASQINTDAKAYQDYISYKAQVEAAKEDAKQADQAVSVIEDERTKMIEAAKFPKGISIADGNITVDGFPLDNKQISSSKKYITAMRIGAITMGEVKAMYFDASYLDRHSLAEIETWAAEQTWGDEKGLQMLIERPDFEGGEIKYELIETTTNTAE